MNPFTNDPYIVRFNMMTAVFVAIHSTPNVVNENDCNFHFRSVDLNAHSSVQHKMSEFIKKIHFD